ncbi:MAG TPA: SAM-dependent methyltransferase [Pontiella sp.]|nr:SAM-dependent methyltransferase [Pontiella sp.]
MGARLHFTRHFWQASIKPVLRRMLYEARQHTARLLRSILPAVEKIVPSAGRSMRAWHWIWQPTFSAQYLHKFYEKGADPFKFDSNPYESEKYAYSLSLLEQRTYRHALEIGAAEGAFTVLLARICDKVTAVEIAAPAVERARLRLQHVSNVDILQAALPNQVPAGPFDLIVASDVLYYLPKDVLFDSLKRIQERLMPGGYFFALHYMGDFGQPLLGDEVHSLLKKHCRLNVIHDETRFGQGPKAEKGFAVTIFQKQDASV